MLCPICKTELITTCKRRLQSIEESVLYPNDKASFKDAFHCPNKECEASKDNLCWNEWGEYYMLDWGKSRDKEYAFINNNNGPFGSFQRKCNVEVGKHDEDFYLINLKIPFINIRIRLKVSWKYEGNEDGEVLKRIPKFYLIVNDIYYISGLGMLVFCLKQFYKQKPVERMKEELSCGWDRRWWRRLFVFYIKTVHRAEYKLYIARSVL